MRICTYVLNDAALGPERWSGGGFGFFQRGISRSFWIDCAGDFAAPAAGQDFAISALRAALRAVALRTPQGAFSWSFGPIHLVAPAGAVRGEFLFRVEKEPMAQATLSWPFGPIHLEDARGVAQDGHFVSIFAVPLEPPLRGTRTCRREQNFRRASSSRISYPSLRPVGQSSLTTSLLLSNANPLRWALRWGPPAAACLGGKLQPVRFHNSAWIYRANAPGVEYAVWAAPCGRPRAGLGPAPTKWGMASVFIVGAAISRPSLPPPRGKVPSVCEADEGDLFA